MFFVKYRNHSKLCKSVDEANLRKLFAISQSVKLFLQNFNEEFEDYVDCDWDEVKNLKNKKLKLCEETEVSSVENELKTETPEELNEEKNVNIECYTVKTDTQNISPCSFTLKKDDSSDTIIISQIEEIPLQKYEGIEPLRRENAFLSQPFYGPSTSASSGIPQEYLIDPFETENAHLPQPFYGPSTSASSGIPQEPATIDPLETENAPPPKHFDGPSTSASSGIQNYGTLPTSYSLPFINPQSKLGVALKKEQQLSKSLKSQFISKIFESFAEKKIFYVSSGNQYAEIVNAILTKYPHLGLNLPYKSAKQLWTRILYTKFYNAKKRDVIDEVEANQKKKMKTSLTNLEKGFGIPFYRPIPSADDEDEMTVESHKQWLINEYKKNEQNESAITKRMDLTFFDRRKMLFSHGENVATLTSADILKSYPCLRLQNQVVLEAKRLFGNDLFPPYLSIIETFAAATASHLDSCKSKYKGYLDSLIAESNSQRDGDCILIKLLGITSAVIGENPEHVIGKDTNTTGSPYLKVNEDGSTTLLVDGTAFIDPVSPQKAVFVWVTAFLIFNIAVPKVVTKTYNFLQFLIFGIPEFPPLTTQGLIKIYSIYTKVRNEVLQENN